MAQKRSRRDFLSGNPASTRPADSGGTASPSGEPIQRQALDDVAEDSSSYLLHIARPAMACTFEAMFNVGQYPHAHEKGLEALDAVDALEDQLSFFRPASQLSRINCVAADAPTPVEPRLFALLQSCRRLHDETDGAFDITSTPLWELWGFARRAGRIPSDEELEVARRAVGDRFLDLDPENHTVFFRNPGVRLNLGSIGKGYALDRAGEVFREAGIADYLVHGGYSSVRAAGVRWDGLPPNDDTGASAEPSSPSPRRGWSVGVRDPLRPDRRLGEIRLRDRALGTSGSTIQFFRHAGRRYGHILDPRTGRPADKVLSTTVLAPTAALADALSTALFVLGPEQAVAYCRKHPEVAAILICPKDRRNDYDVHTIGFAPGELTLKTKAIVHRPG